MQDSQSQIVRGCRGGGARFVRSISVGFETTIERGVTQAGWLDWQQCRIFDVALGPRPQQRDTGTMGWQRNVIDLVIATAAAAARL